MPTVPNAFNVAVNLYASGALDQVLARWAEPLRRDILGRDADLWVLRYARGGEHVKLRVRCRADDRAALQSRIEQLAERCLATLPAPTGEPRVEASPPVDVEDDGAVRDRCFTSPRYRPEPIVFGPSPLPDDAEHVERMTDCLVASTDRVLDLVASRGADADPLPHGARQGLVLAAAIDAMRLLPPDRRLRYLDYHRGWLIRDTGRGNPAVAERLRHRFDGIRAAQATALRPIAESIDAADASSDAADTPWTRGLDRLAQPARSAHSGWRPDPFGGEVLDAVLFKALHAMANQVGLRIRDEALAYHLLYELWSERQRHAA